MPRRFAALLAAATLQLVALVLAHDLVFLARYGSRFGEALAHAGHGETWNAAVTTSLVLGAVLAGLAVFRLARLGLLVRRSGASRAATGTGLRSRSLLRAWLSTGPRLAALGFVLLTIQENIERASMGQPMPGPGILLSPEYAGGLWITIGVGLAVGLVAALFEWRRDVLLAKLRAARAPLPRTSTAGAARPVTIVHRPPTSLLGRRSALRAPPLAGAI